jgi:hypothetical protein
VIRRDLIIAFARGLTTGCIVGFIFSLLRREGGINPAYERTPIPINRDKNGDWFTSARFKGLGICDDEDSIGRDESRNLNARQSRLIGIKTGIGAPQPVSMGLTYASTRIRSDGMNPAL